MKYNDLKISNALKKLLYDAMFSLMNFKGRSLENEYQ